MRRGNFYYMLDILSFFAQTFTIYRTTDEGKGHSVPLSLFSNTLKY